MVTAVNKGLNTHYGDLVLDQECLFAIRAGIKVHFTRNERAILRALSRKPNQLMRRSRLLDEIAADEDRSDRYIDFLVNRIRSKLGDDPKSPKFIHTRYGEGYVWAATSTAAAPVDALLVIATKFAPAARQISQGASALVERLHSAIGAGVSPDKTIVVAEDWRPGADDKLRHLLHLNFQTSDDAFACVVTLREMPSRRITESFALDLHQQNYPNFTAEADTISRAVLAAVQGSLGNASTGLGLAPGDPIETRRHEASIVLLGANPRWASGTQLAKKRAQAPGNADLAFQWCLHLFSRLTVASPFESVGLVERQRVEREIEVTALEHLPAAEDNPLLMFAAAKLLYFVDRGHLELAEDLAERALARTGDSTASFALMGQLRCARGRFDEAVRFFDRGAERGDLGPDFQLHIRAMKCIALLATGKRAALDATVAAIDTAPPCPPYIASMLDWTFSPHERPLSAASAKALAAIGPTAASNAIEYAYFTSARQLVSEQARANLMRGLIAQVVRIYGAQAVPAVVGRAIGSNAVA
ncbi:helix-turn-helix domain-containing protein [Sphingomonas nostoxanthinifaciens]|uniref:helix-turn-helix domain-containing protein n=1 Tax=Sphingomonas nostoxanthinifaciens TaxID=2872652 RepID=UPI002954D433|nr:helix-turn-helix domain-containing protein [Sphingomonas nostoxanthinifaciens]